MTHPRKKPSTGRRRSKKRTPRRRVSEIIAIVAVMLLAATVIYVIGYQFGFEAARAQQRIAAVTDQEQIRMLQSKLKQAKLKSARHEYEAAPPQPVKRPEPPISNVTRPVKPMLAIIFDDVSFSHDVKRIEALNLPVTMSFLPPTKGHPQSAKLAEKEPFYMVHLPLEAMSYGNEEPLTLHVGDAIATIESRVRRIKSLFPRVRFVNNHTGSRFTADETSMRRLIDALDDQGITFIDSRTTGKSTVPGVMQRLKRPYIGRDVFLDHDQDVASVKRQIRRAIKIAEKSGYAIAIGHPHKNTLRAIAESRPLLETVALMRIDELVAVQWP